MSSMRNLYELIGCSKDATTEQILAEYRHKVLALHPDKVMAAAASDQCNSAGDNANERFQQLQFAKEVLADEQKRKHYDLWLQFGQGMALNDWMANQNKIRQTFHWAAIPVDSTRQLLPPKTAAAGTECAGNGTGTAQWHPYESATTRAFRNYQI